MKVPFFTKNPEKPISCSIYITPEKIYMARVLKQAHTQTTLHSFAQIAFSKDSFKKDMKSLLEKYGLKELPCNWVLHAQDYQALLLDAPVLSPSEIPLALRWQIKDLIAFPATEAAIQYCTLPSHAGRSKKIYAFIAKQAFLQARLDELREVGFHISSIDVPELALRNIAALYDDHVTYLGLLVPCAKHMDLIISHHKNLLLSRRLEFTQTDVTTPEQLQEMAIQIQQSFGYCQSQLQLDLPKTLLVMSDNSALQDALSSLLLAEVKPLDITHKIQCNKTETEVSAHALLVTVGGAMREMLDHAAN